MRKLFALLTIVALLGVAWCFALPLGCGDSDDDDSSDDPSIDSGQSDDDSNGDLDDEDDGDDEDEDYDQNGDCRRYNNGTGSFQKKCGDWWDDDWWDDDWNDDEDWDDEGVWEDSTSGLMWQNASYDWREWNAAKSYCQNLDWGEYRDWRLPSISELRSLIRGCDATETGGSCGVTDECLGDSDCRDSSCDGCSQDGGPGPGGRYWPGEFADDVSTFWSSSAVAELDGTAWLVYFGLGKVYSDSVDRASNARCVR